MRRGDDDGGGDGTRQQHGVKKFLANRRVVALAVVQGDAFLAVGRRWHRPS